MLPTPAIAFQTGEGWLNEFGWALLALVGAYTLSLYLWSYISRRSEVWKAREGRYIEGEVVVFAREMARTLILVFLAIATFSVASMLLGWWSLPEFGVLMTYLFHAVVALMTIMAAMLVARILRRISRRARMRSMKDEAVSAMAELTALALSYAVYIVAFLAVLLIILWDVRGDPSAAIIAFVQENDVQLAVTAAIVIGIFFVANLVQAFLEDYKFRSRKFDPHVIELLESGTRYALFAIGFLTVLYSIFAMLSLENVGALLVAITLLFIVIGTALSYSTVQNIVSGLALMDTGPFAVGDRVLILGTMVGDVVDKGLMFTTVRTLDGEVVDVPNAELIRQSVHNYSVSDSHAVIVPFEAAVETSHAEVEAIVMRALTDLDGVLRSPRPALRATALRDGRIEYKVVVYSKDVEKDDLIRSEMIFRLQDAFFEKGR